MNSKNEQPDFSKLALPNLKETLTACGRIVVREVIACVQGRRKPDGSPQKTNAPSTVKRKGHDHPVVEHVHRFEKPGTYLITPRDEMSVMIAIAIPENSEIAARLDHKGYEFFGITDKAEEEAFDIMDVYLEKCVQDSFGGKP